MGMKKLTLGTLGLLFSATLAMAGDDFLSFGVKGGVPLNDAFNAASNSSISYITNNHHYTLGPEVEFNLPFGLGIEVDALYQRLGYQSTTAPTAVPGTTSATTANDWDFPLLLKWHFWPGSIRPYVDAGPTFRSLTNINNRVETFFTGGSTTTATNRPAELPE